MIINYSEYIEKDGKNYPNPQFKTLNMAIASNEQEGLENITYYYGSDSKILDLEDYNEYGWEFIVDKYKFNSEFLLNYLPNSSKELIGNKLEDIDKIEKTLFPTSVDQEEGEKSNIKYFGSITIGRQKLIMISVPRGYNELNLFDTTIDNTNPRITVTFLEEEINSNKIVWFVITSGDKNEVLDINLSFFSWGNSINPHRNMNRYLLRNDEFHNTLADLNIFDNLKSDKEDPLYVDLSSNTIVGNKRVDVSPEGSSIIQSKLNKYKGDSDEDWDKYKGNPRWDRYITYSEGQQAKYLGVDWISLENNNRGNRPDTSSLWLKSSMFSDDFKAKRVMSVVRKRDIEDPDKNDPDKSIPGYVFPSVFTVPIVPTNLELSITYLNGYKLKSITDSSGISTKLEESTPSQLDYDTYTSEDQTMKIVDVPANIVGNPPGAALMFDFTKIRCPLKVKIHHPTQGTSEIPNLDPNSVMLKDQISLERIIIDTANTNIVGLEKEYYIGGEKVNSRMLNIPTLYKEEGDGSSYIDIEDVADLPAFYEYNIYLETIYYTISISDHVGFYVDKSEIIVPKTNTSVDENYRISPTNGVLSEGIKYHITYLIEGEEYDSNTINYDPSISATTVTVNGVIYTMTTVNSSYFNLRISGEIDRDIKLKIWK